MIHHLQRCKAWSPVKDNAFVCTFHTEYLSLCSQNNSMIPPPKQTDQKAFSFVISIIYHPVARGGGN